MKTSAAEEISAFARGKPDLHSEIKFRCTRLFLLLCFGAMCFSAQSVAAFGDQPRALTSTAVKETTIQLPENLKIGSDVYSRQDLITLFIDTVFSAYVMPNTFPYGILTPPLGECRHWKTIKENKSPLKRVSNNADGYYVRDAEICTDSDEIKQTYPWLHEHWYHDKGFPRLFAVNKWTTPIRITTGYPNDLKPQKPSGRNAEELRIVDQGVASTIPSPDYRQFLTPERAQAAEQTTQDAVEEITNTIPLIKELTGLEVSYVPHEKETPEHQGNLRIVIVDNAYGWKTHFKRNAIAPAGQYQSDSIKYVSGNQLISRGELYFPTVEQFILSKVTFTPYTEQQVDGFILPGGDNSIEMAFCFLSNKNDTETTKALVRECLIRSLGIPNAARHNSHSILSLWNDHSSSLAKSERWTVGRPAVSDLDNKIIELLYSPAVKPGMSVTEVLNLLTK